MGEFDESLGVGAGTPWGSSEEMDFIIRAIRQGSRLRYDPDLVVFHPQTVSDFDRTAAQRHLSYSRGFGRVLKKHGYPFSFVFWSWFRSLGGLGLALARMNMKAARYYRSGLTGKIMGWFDRQPFL